MVKIGMLLPEADMVPMAEKVVKDMNVEIACLKAISSVDVVNEARLAVEAGAKIVIDHRRDEACHSKSNRWTCSG